MWTEGGQLSLLAFSGVRGSKGGGGGGMSDAMMMYLLEQNNKGTTGYTDPVDSTVYNTPEELNQHIAQRTQTAADTAAATKAAADAETASKQSAFDTRKAAARQSAIDSAMAAFRQQGVDPTAYLSTDITPTVDRYTANIPNLDANPGSVYSSTLGQDIVNSVLSGKRGQNVDLLNQTFTPGYSRNVLPSSASSPYIDQLLGEQFDPLSAGIQNARNRGTLNDSGYAGALSALTNKKSAARATINSLAEGVLGSDRSALDDYISGARTSVGNLSLSGSNAFDPSTYTNTAANMANTDLSNLGGDIRNKVGDTQFATLTDLLNAGGLYQGPIDTRAKGLGTSTPTGIGGLTEAQQREDSQRGLGSSGTF